MIRILERSEHQTHDCCSLEKPCDVHILQALGDKITDVSQVTVKLPQTVPGWIKNQFLFWNNGMILEVDFIQVIVYMAKEEMILYQGNKIEFSDTSNKKP